MLTRTGEILRSIHCEFASLRCPPRPVLPSGSSVLVGSAGWLAGGGGSAGSHALRSGADITASSMQKRAPATKNLATRGSFQFPDRRRVLLLGNSGHGLKNPVRPLFARPRKETGAGGREMPPGHPDLQSDNLKKTHSHRQRRPDRHAACPDWGPSNTQQEHRYDRQPSAT